MGQKPFPREDKLQFIIKRIGEGASDAEIQEDLLEFGPSGRVPRGQHGVFGEVGIRTIRNIRQVYVVTKELTKTQTKGQDFAIRKANAEHLDAIQLLIQKWRSSFDTRYRPVDGYVLPPSYGFEQEKLFPYVLAHCPSVNDEYQTLMDKKREYQAQSSELKKIQSAKWRQTFIKIEGELKDALEMSLLSHEYSRHRCELCTFNNK